jgi:excinuclease ABC subunit C
MKRSRLSEIPGLGPKRVRDLLAHFRSIDAIQLASVERIAEAPGMGPALARQVWEYFHPDEDGPGLDGDGESETSADALVGAGAD